LRVVGERVEKGEPMALLHARSPRLIEPVVKRATQAFAIGARAPARKLVLARIG
jgi:thymidine phosphorylase